jgi:hypothetical protein
MEGILCTEEFFTFVVPRVRHRIPTWWSLVLFNPRNPIRLGFLKKQRHK